MIIATASPLSLTTWGAYIYHNYKMAFRSSYYTEYSAPLTRALIRHYPELYRSEEPMNVFCRAQLGCTENEYFLGEDWIEKHSDLMEPKLSRSLLSELTIATAKLAERYVDVREIILDFVVNNIYGHAVTNVLQYHSTKELLKHKVRLGERIKRRVGVVINNVNTPEKIEFLKSKGINTIYTEDYVSGAIPFDDIRLDKEKFLELCTNEIQIKTMVPRLTNWD